MAHAIAMRETKAGVNQRLSLAGMEQAEPDALVHLERIEGVIQVLRGSAETFSLEDLAEMACLSPFHFNREGSKP